MPVFEWHEDKAQTNLAKHRLSFPLASRIWDDPLHMIVPDGIYDGEERWLAIGSINGVVVIVVAHAYRERNGEEIIRIISARKATPHERRRYEQSALD